MAVEVVRAAVVGPSNLYLHFSDGVSGEVNVADVVPFRGVFAPLADAAFFAQATVDAHWGVVSWPGNIDLAPESLYAAAVRP